MNDGITDSMDMSLSKLQEVVKDSESQRVRHYWATEQQEEAVLPWRMTQQIDKMNN